jgi:hypothetical protein
MPFYIPTKSSSPSLIIVYFTFKLFTVLSHRVSVSRPFIVGSESSSSGGASSSVVEFTYAVKYVLGGGEKKVEEKYITLDPLNGQGKQRSVLGRCR